MGNQITVPEPHTLSAEARAAVLNDKPSLSALIKLLQSGRAQKILVVCGAGISVAAGIPDFRSPGSGLYSQLKAQGVERPEAVFDIAQFAEDQGRAFYTVAEQLWPGEFHPTKAHYFLATLARKGLLQRVYTQNIDTLEELAGVPRDLLVEAHGSFASASCVDCARAYTPAWVAARAFHASEAKPGIPRCQACRGLVKPDITFFGERLPARYHTMIERDVAAADLLLVMGTSLAVQPVAHIPQQVGVFVPRVLVNKDMIGDAPSGEMEGLDGEELFAKAAELGMDLEEVGVPGGFRFLLEDNYRDIFLPGEADAVVQQLVDELGWQDEFAQARAAGQAAATERQDELAALLRKEIELALSEAAAEAVAEEAAPAAAPGTAPQPMSTADLLAALPDAPAQAVEAVELPAELDVCADAEALFEQALDGAAEVQSSVPSQAHK